MIILIDVENNLAKSKSFRIKILWKTGIIIIESATLILIKINEINF